MSTQQQPNQGTAVVTGASSGLGKVYADRLAKRGYDLILVARRGDKLESIAAELRAAYGVKVSAMVADLGAPADLERVAAAIMPTTASRCWSTTPARRRSRRWPRPARRNSTA